MKKPLAAFSLVFFTLLLSASTAAAFTNNRYLAYGRSFKTALAKEPEVLASYSVNDAYISGLVTQDVNNLITEGALKGQKGDKGDSGEYVENVLGTSTPQDGIAVPAPVIYNLNIPGNIAGFTELSGGDVVAQTSLTVDSGAPVEISAGSSLEVDANANFTASTTMGDLDVATIESPSGAYLSDGGDWVNASSRDLKTNLATVSPQSVLTQINALPIYTWNYKTQTASSTHMGPMAQDFYSTFGLGDSSSSISTIDPAGVALAGIQGLDAKISSLMDLSWILNGLKNLGLNVEQGFIKVESLIADKVQTNQLEVGSADNPTGITIYDTVTGQPVCVFSSNNILQTSAGKCGTVSQSAAQTPPLPDPDDSNSTTSAGGTISVLPADLGQPTSTPASTTLGASSDSGNASSTPNN